MALWPDIAEQTRAVVRIAARRWNLQLANGVIVKLPEAVSRKSAAGAFVAAPVAALARLADLQARHRILQRDVNEIDMCFPGQLVVRLSKDAATRRNFLLNSGGKRPRGGQDT